MFTGIVTDIGTVLAVREAGDRRVEIGTTFDASELDLGASVACSGVCLTVVQRSQRMFAVDVSAETLSLTAAGHWGEGARLNLERSLRVGDELGGHIVLGHVDGVGVVEAVAPDGGSTRLTIRAPRRAGALSRAKGFGGGGRRVADGERGGGPGGRHALHAEPHPAHLGCDDPAGVGAR